MANSDSDMLTWANDICGKLYDTLERKITGSFDAGMAWINRTAGSVTNGLRWIWEALQGDWSDARTPAQIAADAVLGLVPVVDTILDIRDLCANCTKLKEDSGSKAVWIAIALTLIGFIPELGSVVKGVFKIIFHFLRKFGNDTRKALDAALGPILSFLRNEKTRKLIGVANVGQVFKDAAAAIRKNTGKVNTSTLLGYFDQGIATLKSIIGKMNYVLPERQVALLRGKLQVLIDVRAMALKQLDPALGPVRKLLDDIAQWLEKKAVKLEEEAASTNVKNLHHIDLNDVDPRILTRGKKGIYGEIVSDNHMASKGHKSILPEDRRYRSLEDKPRGRGIDGIYENANPPPAYIVTETKYRTGAGANTRYIDGDGTETTELLCTTKGSKGYRPAKQMSDEWIKPRLREEVGGEMEEAILDGKYDRWLMIVDESGKVISITRLDSGANAIGKVPL